MTTENLNQKLEALTPDVDYSDPQTYANLLYGEDAGQPAGDGQTGAPGDTAAAPAAAPAPAPAAAAPAPAPAPAAESGAAPGAAEPTGQAEENVEGVATADGKRVIPYAVLKQTRETARTAAERARELAEANARLTQELEAARSGQAAPAATTPVADFSPEELAELEADFPAMAKLAKGYRALQEQLARTAPVAAPAPAAPGMPAEDPAATVQTLIDNNPLLARWQAKGGWVWDKAVERDKALAADPTWATKSMADRFAEVQRQIADELGVPLPQESNTAPAPAPASAAALKAPAPAVPTSTPPTLTDLGGGPVVSSSDPLAGMTKGQMVDRAMAMDLETLQRMVGVTT